MNIVIDAIKHESSDIRIAACTCLRSVSRSIKVGNVVLILSSLMFMVFFPSPAF